MTLGPSEQEIIIKTLEAVTVSGMGYILRQFYKVIQNVTIIPKLKSDLDMAHKKIRAIEGKLSMQSDNANKSPDSP